MSSRIVRALEAIARARAELTPSTAGLLSDRVQRATIDLDDARSELLALTHATATPVLAVELREARVGVTRCTSAGCGGLAVEIVHWPGHDALPMCSGCVTRAQRVAHALGFDLHVAPLTGTPGRAVVGGDVRVPRCACGHVYRDHFDPPSVTLACLVCDCCQWREAR